MKSYKYHYSRYNAHDVVKINLITLLSTLFMSRHILGVYIIGMAFRPGRTGTVRAHGAFDGLIEPIYMIADIPALLLLLAMLARHPKGGPIARFVWRCGPYLLLTSALIYFFLLFDTIGWTPHRYGMLVWGSILGNLAIVAYVFLSPYARDLFQQFPERLKDEEKSS